MLLGSPFILLYLVFFLHLVQCAIAFSLTMTNDRNRVVVVGSANQDLTSYTPTLPVLGETVMGQSFEMGCGGKGANQANAAASLGICPVTMICRIGDDIFGEALLKNFRRTGVQLDEKTTLLSGQSTGVATIVVDTTSGDNMIIVIPGANQELKPADVRRALSSMRDDPPAVVVVQLEITKEAALEAVKVAKEIGAITVLNPAPAPEDGSLEDFWPYVDILIPNESELRTLCRETEDDEAYCNEETLAKSLLEKGIGKAVIVTLGARGAMVVEKDCTTFVAAPEDLPCKDMPIIDTIGAGDAFCGALSTYMSAGIGMKEAAVLACGFAGMSVRRRGASYPSADELPDCLRIDAHRRSVATKSTLTFVTGNYNKLKEVQRILVEDGDLPYNITNQKIDLPELQGEILEIAKEKCRLASVKVNGPVFTEDTSLCFNALNGMPGPYIKWFLDSCGHDGLNQMLAGFADKSAYAQTVVAFTKGGPDDEIHVFDGRTDGKVVPSRGSLDFGWDPIFEPDEGNGKTYAEMSIEDKNVISHRGRSFSKLRAFLLENQDAISNNEDNKAAAWYW